jgi:glycosyltransferase involved in cell wall biosynthesis
VARVDGPRIAVIIPCYNDGVLVGETIASVEDRGSVEIVVVDDASPDPETHRLLGELPTDVKVVRHEVNRGVGAARNSGLAASTAPFVFPIDADDLFSPGALAAMRAALERDPGAAVAYGDYLEFGDHHLLRAVPETLDTYRLLWTNEYPPSAMWRRTALEEVGGYCEDLIEGRYYYEDWDLWLSAAERGHRGLHMGPGFATYLQRVHGPRLLETLKQRHAALYRAMRNNHADTFAARASHRRRSDLGRLRKLAYPVVYGPRRRLAFEAKLKEMLDRLGIWTLRR